MAPSHLLASLLSESRHTYDDWENAGHLRFGCPLYKLFLVAFLVGLDELVGALAFVGLQKAGDTKE